MGELSLLLSLVSWCHVMAVSEDIPESQSQMGRGENSLKSKTFLISSILDKGAAQPGDRQVGDRKMALWGLSMQEKGREE